MITNELFKRITTSLILFFFIYLCYLNDFFLKFGLFIVFVLSFYEFINLLKKIKNKIKLDNFLYFIIIGLFFIYLYVFTNLTFSNFINIETQLLSIYILFVCILTDIGSLVFGKIFGGKKLTKISPNKTISGSIGGILFSIIIFLVSNDFINMNTVVLFVLTLITSISSQIGDLFFSYLKRKAGVKDTGKILPGHGGLLDRIDGILLGFPVGIIFIHLIN